IERGGRTPWDKKICSGEQEMCHSMQKLEHHHFKFEAHRRPGDVYFPFLWADCLSFGESIQLAGWDVMEIGFQGFGRALRNCVHVDRPPSKRISVTSLG